MGFNQAIIRFNNWIVRLRRIRVPRANILLLLPRCLQLSDCPIKLSGDINECKRCGKCNIAELVALREEMGIQCAMATGGGQALALTRAPDVKAVVACACEKELVQGIRAAFPKPVLAVWNEQPSGPCFDTRVDLDDVRAAIDEITVN